jgi:hypothetical protein
MKAIIYIILVVSLLYFLGYLGKIDADRGNTKIWKKIVFNNILLDKKIITEDHGSMELIFADSSKSYLCFYSHECYDFIKPGDSLIKNINETNVTVIRNGQVKIFYY